MSSNMESTATPAKQMAAQIRRWLKKNGFNHAQVKTLKTGTIVIDNIGLNEASTVAHLATGRQFQHMTPSMTRLID